MSPNSSHLTHSAQETESLAAQFASTLRPGACIALEGELGAGKTQFVRGIVRGLRGDPKQVSSPTFVLLHIYPTAGPTVYHLDAYRVGGAEDFAAIGFSELLEQGGIVLVEWASRVKSALPPDTIHVQLDHQADASPGSENRRRITISSTPDMQNSH